MATAQTMQMGHEGHSRRRLRNFMRRLAKRKPSNDAVAGPIIAMDAAANSESSKIYQQDHQPTSQSLTHLPQTHSQQSIVSSCDDNEPSARTARSIAPTIATQPGTTHSDTKSRSGTFTTGGGALSTHELGGEGSTFSSPAPSVRSLTTTLTTIHSTAAGNLLNNNHQPAPQSSSSAHFTQPFPTSSNPPSAIPPHLTNTMYGSSHPHTYTTATANNVLTDDASILTLASSTKRRRRNSLDTNASVRALAPNSVFGGSRESLPLSILSANISSQEQREAQGSGAVSGAASMVSAHVIRSSLAGTAAAERASVYSGSGVLAGPSGEARDARSSYHASRPGADGVSVRSGLLGHGRNDSMTGSIGGQASPLASPTVAEKS